MTQISKLGWLTIKNEEFETEKDILNVLRYHKTIHDKKSKGLIHIIGITFEDCIFRDISMDLGKTFKSSYAGEIKFSDHLSSIFFIRVNFYSSLFTLDSKIKYAFDICGIDNTDFTTRIGFTIDDKGCLAFNSCTLSAITIRSCMFDSIEFNKCYFASDEYMIKDKAINSVTSNECNSIEFNYSDICNLKFAHNRITNSVSINNSYLHSKDKTTDYALGYGIVEFEVKPEQLKVFKSDFDIPMFGGEVYKATNIGPLGLTYYFYTGIGRIACDNNSYLRYTGDEAFNDLMRLDDFTSMIMKKYNKTDIMNLESKEEKNNMIKYRKQYRAMIEYFKSLDKVYTEETLKKLK